MEQLIKIVQNILFYFNIEDADINVSEQEETILINIHTETGRFLIGNGGTNLKDLEFLIRLLAQKNNFNKKICLDINSYRKNRENQLKKLAKETAHKVMITKSAIKLPPMNAYERRIIHMELAISPNVTTESVGEEPNRCLIIKPYP